MLHGLGLVRGLGHLALQRVDAVATHEIWQVAWQSGNLAFSLRQHGQENQHDNVLGLPGKRLHFAHIDCVI